jgi:murein DD-endopeptidase MepM/ murein hydrolase activator NlpD
MRDLKGTTGSHRVVSRRHSTRNFQRSVPSTNSVGISRHGLWLTSLIVANVGVVCFHGDPRDLLPQSSQSRTVIKKKTASTKILPSLKSRLKAAGTAKVKHIPALSLTQKPKSSPTQGAHLLGSKAQNESVPTQRKEISQILRRAQALAQTTPRETTYDPLLGLRNPRRVQRVVTVHLKSGESAAGALKKAGIPPEEARQAIASLKKHIDFRRMQPGQSFKARLDHDERLLSLDVPRNLRERFRTTHTDTTWDVEALPVDIQKIRTPIHGTVNSSLWSALVDTAGERPILVHDVVGVFAWEIDFYRQVFPGDTFRLLVEKEFIDGQFVDYGKLLAAEFVSAGKKSQAFIHCEKSSAAKSGEMCGYYDTKGHSLRKQLLKAPLKYGRVTSGFGRRRHPVLGYSRRHNGTDYGVPTGTPVWSVGDGMVTRAGWFGGYGKFVEVRHANGWLSQYAHLSHIGVKRGQKVSQKETVGRVGTTGLSTGPHLHYGLKHHGQYVNSLKQKFVQGKSLRGTELKRFEIVMTELKDRLDNMHKAVSEGMGHAQR